MLQNIVTQHTTYFCKNPLSYYLSNTYMYLTKIEIVK